MPFTITFPSLPGSVSFSGKKGRSLFLPVQIALSGLAISDTPTGLCALNLSIVTASAGVFSISAVPGLWAFAAGVARSPSFNPHGSPSFSFTAFPVFDDPSSPGLSGGPYNATFRAQVLDELGVSFGDRTFTLNGSASKAAPCEVVFVCDRAYSMATLSRLTRLQNAVSAGLALFQSTDSIGMTSLPNVNTTILVADQVAVLPGNASAVSDKCARLTVDTVRPRRKSLPEGIAAGQLLSPTATVVLVTDGTTDVDPSAAPTSPTAALILVDEFSRLSPSLNLLVSDPNACLQADPSALGAFAPEKLFTQLITDLTECELLIDPDGSLEGGQKFEFPVDINETEREVQVIVFSEHAAELNVDLQRAHPRFERYASEPAVAHATNERQGFKPVRSARSISLRTAVPQQEVGGHQSFQVVVSRPEKGRDELNRFTVIVAAKSDLRLTAAAAASGISVGSELLFSAYLTEYGIPISESPELMVNVQLTHPDGGTELISLAHRGHGRFEGSRRTYRTGLYTAHYVATGYTFLKHRPFRRECVRTVSIFSARPPVACCTEPVGSNSPEE